MTIIFVHGMRVLNLVEEPPGRAVAPAPLPEKEGASLQEWQLPAGPLPGGPRELHLSH